MDIKLRTSVSAEDMDIMERINTEAIPDNERTSLYDMRSTGADIIGIYADGEPVGFLAVRIFERICYLAYFAVRRDMRSSGIGGEALRQLIDSYSGYQVIAEHEAPDSAAPDSDIRRRRKRFYLRNGFHETGWYNYYDDTEFEIVCSDSAFDDMAFGRFVAHLETFISDKIPRPYRKDRP
ncbi:MAG: GNAT family N-acetyltransferase [Oscillospiraceae bacterium]|nr:GNAT family N-acetyltransferase [Oscillospiraceae bacterium]